MVVPSDVIPYAPELSEWRLMFLEESGVHVERVNARRTLLHLSVAHIVVPLDHRDLPSYLEDGGKPPEYASFVVSL